MSASARHHASWIKLASWRDSTEPGTAAAAIDCFTGE
jgi:hypothetical protein